MNGRRPRRGRSAPAPRRRSPRSPPRPCPIALVLERDRRSAARWARRRSEKGGDAPAGRPPTATTTRRQVHAALRRARKSPPETGGISATSSPARAACQARCRRVDRIEKAVGLGPELERGPDVLDGRAAGRSTSRRPAPACSRKPANSLIVTQPMAYLLLDSPMCLFGQWRLHYKALFRGGREHEATHCNFARICSTRRRTTRLDLGWPGCVECSKGRREQGAVKPSGRAAQDPRGTAGSAWTTWSARPQRPTWFDWACRPGRARRCQRCHGCHGCYGRNRRPGPTGSRGARRPSVRVQRPQGN